MDTFAKRVINFNDQLHFKGKLPMDIRVMNPFKENKEVVIISKAFYEKYYNDYKRRHIILGINPGRFGAGCTGVPFTDSKRLESECGIAFPGIHTHEPSAVFIYDMIREMGGPDFFYKHFYIQSICPLGFTRLNEKGNHINYNYYDSKPLADAALPFIMKNLEDQIKMGVSPGLAFCLGTGKNFSFLEKLNAKHQFFDRIIPLEHPRFIMQYRAKRKQEYVQKYLEALGQAL